MLLHVSSYCCICVLILQYVCPHTAIYVSSYCNVCVLILLYMCPPGWWGGRFVLLFESGPNRERSLATLLGFEQLDYRSTGLVSALSGLL